VVFFFSSRRRHTRFKCDWSSDVCSSDLLQSDESVVLGGSVRTWAAWGGGSCARVRSLSPSSSSRTTLSSLWRWRTPFAGTGAKRSEERRVGKEGRQRMGRGEYKEKESYR